MNTLAQDIMSTEVLSVREGTPIEDALKMLVNSRITGLPVVDASGKMVGIFSDYDVLIQISGKETSGSVADKKTNVFREPIQFTRKIEAVQVNTQLSQVMKLFIDSRFRRLPVISGDGKLVGIITRRDLMKLFYYRAALREEG